MLDTWTLDSPEMATHVLVPMDASLPQYVCWEGRWKDWHLASWVRQTTRGYEYHPAWCDTHIPPIYELDTRDLDYSLWEVRIATERG